MKIAKFSHACSAYLLASDTMDDHRSWMSALKNEKGTFTAGVAPGKTVKNIVEIFINEILINGALNSV